MQSVSSLIKNHSVNSQHFSPQITLKSQHIQYSTLAGKQHETVSQKFCMTYMTENAVFTTINRIKGLDKCI